MCACVCVCVCVYIYIYIYIYRVYVCVCVCVYIYIYIVYVYINIYIYIYIYIYLFIYIYIYIYTHTPEYVHISRILQIINNTSQVYVTCLLLTQSDNQHENWQLAQHSCGSPRDLRCSLFGARSHTDI